eukprot:s6093_g1.t1
MEEPLECQLCRSRKHQGHLDPDNLLWYCEEMTAGLASPATRAHASFAESLLQPARWTPVTGDGTGPDTCSAWPPADRQMAGARERAELQSGTPPSQPSRSMAVPLSQTAAARPLHVRLLAQ